MESIAEIYDNKPNVNETPGGNVGNIMASLMNSKLLVKVEMQQVFRILISKRNFENETSKPLLSFPPGLHNIHKNRILGSSLHID